jgi:hypothetical protein
MVFASGCRHNRKTGEFCKYTRVRFDEYAQCHKAVQRALARQPALAIDEFRKIDNAHSATLGCDSAAYQLN